MFSYEFYEIKNTYFVEQLRTAASEHRIYLFIYLSIYLFVYLFHVDFTPKQIFAADILSPTR